MDHADLRRRLLLVIGALTTPVIAHALDSADSGGTPVGSTYCAPLGSGGSCPDGSKVNASKDGCALELSGPGTLTGDQCCYEVVSSDCGPVGMGCGCAHGRPLLREAAPVLAPLGRSRWFDATLPAPDESALSAPLRGRLARFWASVGAHEHSSIAAFHRASLELLALGAPDALLAATQRAALDEARHARHAFTLASRIAGASIGPGPLPLGLAVELAADLPALAARVVREVCLEETMSLFAAERMLAAATDPAVRRVLVALTRDERRHVELGWRTLRWAIDAGGLPVRRASAAAFAAARPPAPSAPEPLPPSLAVWGAVADEELCLAAAEGLRAVILPVGAALAA